MVDMASFGYIHQGPSWNVAATCNFLSWSEIKMQAESYSNEAISFGGWKIFCRKVTKKHNVSLGILMLSATYVWPFPTNPISQSR